MSIEKKIKEMEQTEYELTELVPDESATVNGGPAKGVILMYASEVNSVLDIYGKQQGRLIAALREAITALEFYGSPWGCEHGFSDPTNEAIQRILGEKRFAATNAIEQIESILNGQTK